MEQDLEGISYVSQSVVKFKSRKSPTEDQMIRREAALLQRMVRKTRPRQRDRLRLLRLTESSRLGRVLVGAPEASCE